MGIKFVAAASGYPKWSLQIITILVPTSFFMEASILNLMWFRFGGFQRTWGWLFWGIRWSQTELSVFVVDKLAPEVCSSLRTTICFVFSISSTSVQKLLPRIKSGLLCSNTLAIQPEKSKGCSLEICKQNVSNLLTLKECMLNSFLS